MKSSIPTIAITGSSGFLGQYLLHSFVHEPLDQTVSPGKTIQIHALYGGHMKGFPEAVKALVTAANTKNNNANIQVTVHALDLTNQNDVQAWMTTYAPQVDVCIHAAALSVPRLCEADPAQARALNVPSQFLEGLAHHGVHIVGLSTDQVYDGIPQKGQPNHYSENHPVAPLNVYGTTKVELEECLQKLSTNNNKISTVALRSSIILGPKAPILGEQAHATFLHFCAGRQHQETTFYTDECRSVIAVDNVVDVLRWFALKACLLSDDDTTIVGGVYNMGGPERVSRMDMAQAVFRNFGYNEDKLVAAEKATMPLQEVQSPLDIAMDSSKLYQLVGDAVKFKSVKDIVSWTFNNRNGDGKGEVT